MNGLVLLYGVVDFYARHLISSEIIAIENDEIKVLVNKNELSKADRMIFDDFFKILKFLSKLEEIAYNNIKTKWMRILQGLKDYKGLDKGYAAVIVGISLLEAYAKRHPNFIHPNRIKKLLDLMKKEAKIEEEGEFKYTSRLILDSAIFAEKIAKQLGVDNVSKTA